MAKNIDYTQSAENLVNPESVRLLLLKRLGLNARMDELQFNLAMRNVDLNTKIKDLTIDLAANKSEIENAVLTDGGYQDCESGLYALRQRRVSIEYNVLAFKRDYPQFVPAVIKEVIDPVAITGLIKGKLILLIDMLRNNTWPPVATEKPTFAFVIRADPQTEVRGK